MKISSLLAIVCSVQSTLIVLFICLNVRYINSYAAWQRKKLGSGLGA